MVFREAVGAVAIAGNDVAVPTIDLNGGIVRRASSTGIHCFC